MVEELVNYADLILAVIVILGGAWSWWRGTLRDLIVNIRRIEDIEEKQEDMADGIVALAHASRNDRVEVNPAELENDLRDEDKGPGRYTEGSLYRGTEDEEESKTDGGLKPEVREP